MEQRGLDFDPGSPRTFGREDAEVATNSAQGSGVEGGSDDYDIVLDASIIINRVNQSNTAFPIQSRYSCDLSGVEQRVNTTLVCKSCHHFVLYCPAVPK